VQGDVGEFKLQQKPSYPRRFFSRVETRLDVWVSWRFNGRGETSRVRNLSLGGLFVETAKSKAVGASLKLDFLVQEGPIWGRGHRAACKVWWTRIETIGNGQRRPETSESIDNKASQVAYWPLATQKLMDVSKVATTCRVCSLKITNSASLCRGSS
jgi:PilZ domain